MIDTRGLGAGSYPDPPESKEKCYTFTCDCSCKMKVSVWAENLESAEDFVKQGEYDDNELMGFEVEDIISYEIES